MAGVTVLDGGIGHLIKQWGVHTEGLPYEQQFLAGVLANLQEPEIVKRAHRAYTTAGARCITTNNFSATRYNLAKIHQQDRAYELIQAAGSLARAVAQEQPHGKVAVAGCLPPLCESYQVEGLPDREEMEREYYVIAAALAPHVDVFLAETLSTSQEAHAAAAACRALGKPLWVSFTLDDSLEHQLRSKEPLEAVVLELLSAFPHIGAVLVNCCAPAAVSAALPVLAQAVPQGVAIGAYANGFKTTTSEWLRGEEAMRLALHEGDYDTTGLITADAYKQFALEWQNMGASLLGGCCGVGPEHIQAISRVISLSGRF